MINYQKSRYACDSAIKYALTTIGEVPLNLVTRKGEPDFSDLFTMNHAEYEAFLAECAERKAAEIAEAEAAGNPGADMANEF